MTLSKNYCTKGRSEKFIRREACGKFDAVGWHVAQGIWLDINYVSLGVSGWKNCIGTLGLWGLGNFLVWEWNRSRIVLNGTADWSLKQHEKQQQDSNIKPEYGAKYDAN